MTTSSFTVNVSPPEEQASSGNVTSTIPKTAQRAQLAVVSNTPMMELVDAYLRRWASGDGWGNDTSPCFFRPSTFSRLPVPLFYLHWCMLVYWLCVALGHCIFLAFMMVIRRYNEQTDGMVSVNINATTRVYWLEEPGNVAASMAQHAWLTLPMALPLLWCFFCTDAVCHLQRGFQEKYPRHSWWSQFIEKGSREEEEEDEKKDGDDENCTREQDMNDNRHNTGSSKDLEGGDELEDDLISYCNDRRRRPPKERDSLSRMWVNMRRRLYLVFVGDQDPLWWKLFFTLATVSSVCCLDKKGMLSYPLATPEKVFFFRKRHRQSGLPLYGNSGTGLLRGPKRSSNASFRSGEGTTNNKRWSGHHHHSDRVPSSSFRVFGTGTSLGPSSTMADSGLLPPLNNSTCGSNSHGVILELAVNLHGSRSVLFQKHRGNQQARLRVCNTVAAAPYMPYFVDQKWQRYLSSLKGIGLNILLNNCNVHAMPRYTQFSDHILSLVEQHSGKGDTSDNSSGMNKIAVVNRRCLCGLSLGMGFKTPQATQHFHLEAVLSGYRPAAKETSGGAHGGATLGSGGALMDSDVLGGGDGGDLFGEQPWRRHSPVPNIFSVVTMETLGGGYQLMTQGTGDLLADVCTYYWDGSNIVPMSSVERTRILDFYHRNVFSAYCTGFAYAPLLSKLPKLKAHLDNSTACIPTLKTQPGADTLIGPEVSEPIRGESTVSAPSKEIQRDLSPVPQYPLTILEFPAQERHLHRPHFSPGLAVSGVSASVADFRWRRYPQHCSSAGIAASSTTCVSAVSLRQHQLEETTGHRHSSGQRGSGGTQGHSGSGGWPDKNGLLLPASASSTSGFQGNLVSAVFGLEQKDPTMRLTFSAENLVVATAQESSVGNFQDKELEDHTSLEVENKANSCLSRGEQLATFNTLSTKNDARSRCTPVLEEREDDEEERNVEQTPEELTSSRPTNYGNPSISAAANPLHTFQVEDEARQLQEVLSGQIFLGMVSMQYQALADVVPAVDKLHEACIRFVHFSKENQLRSRVFAERLGLESGWNCHISLQDPNPPPPQTQSRGDETPTALFHSQTSGLHRPHSPAVETGVVGVDAGVEMRLLTPPSNLIEDSTSPSTPGVGVSVPPLVKCLYTTQDTTERMRFSSDPNIFLSMNDNESRENLATPISYPPPTPDERVKQAIDPSSDKELLLDDYQPIAFVAGKSRLSGTNLIVNPPPSSPSGIVKTPSKGSTSSFRRRVWHPLWQLIRSGASLKRNSHNGDTVSSVVLAKQASQPNLMTNVVADIEAPKKPLFTCEVTSPVKALSSNSRGAGSLLCLQEEELVPESGIVQGSVTSLRLSTPQTNVTALKRLDDEPLPSALISPYPSLASINRSDAAMSNSSRLSNHNHENDGILQRPSSVSSSRRSSTTSSSSSKISAIRQEEAECLIKYLKPDMSKLPQGISNIREHLKNVDNVPLQVSLFTDSTPESVCSMIEILQQSGGDIVLTMGSSLTLHNTTTHLQADSGLSMIPMVAPICVQHIHSGSPPTPPPPDSAPRGKDMSNGSATMSQHSIKSSPSNCHSPTPVELASQLLSLPCAVLTQREKGLPLLGGITASRLYYARFLNALSFFLCCHLSLLLWASLLLLLAAIHHVMPPNSLSHHSWSLLLASTRLLPNIDSSSSDVNLSSSCCTTDTSFSLPVHLMPPYALTLLSWFVVPLLTMALMWGNSVAENDPLRKQLWSRPPRKRTKLITRKIVMRIMLANVTRFLPTVFVCVVTTLLNWISFEIRPLPPDDKSALLESVIELAKAILVKQDLMLSPDQVQEMQEATQNRTMPMLSVYGSDAVMSVVAGFALVQLTLYLCEIAICSAYALDSGQRVISRQCPSWTWLLVIAFLSSALVILLSVSWLPYPNRLSVISNIHFSMYLILGGWALLLPILNAYVNLREKSSILAEHRLAKLYFGTKLGMYSPV